MSGAARANFGCFGSETAALEAILTRLATALDPQAIWLFGSRAAGKALPDSDFDLLLVAKPGAAFGSNDYERVFEPLRGLGVGCDIVPCSAEDFTEGAKIKTSLVAQILSYGQKLYDSATR